MISADDFMDLKSRDELLGVFVSDGNILNDAIESLFELASKKQVAKEEVILSQAVKKYIKAYTFLEIAKAKSFAVGYSYQTDNNNGGDAYSSKINIYAEELKEAIKGISAESLTGQRAINSYRTIAIKRS